MSVSLQRNTPKGGNMGYPQQTGYPAGGAPPQQGGQYGQPQNMGAPMQSGMPGQPGMPQQGSMGAPMQSGMPGQPGMQQGQYGQPGMQSMPGQQMPMQGMPGQTGMQQGSMGAPMHSGMPGQPGMQSMPGQMPQGQYGQPQGSMGAPMQSGMPGQQMGGQYGQVGMNPPLNRVSLVKGQNMSLTKAAPGLKHARIGLGWDVRQTPGAAFDLDASCFLLNAQNQVVSPQHFVFYNNRQSPDGSVLQHGDNLTGMGEGDDEQVSVDLLRVPADIQRIVFVCSIYEAEQRQQNFGMVQRAFIRVVDQDTQQEIVRFDLTEEACMWNCMMFGELYRYGNEWKFKALGNGLQGGLRAAGAQFGMQLA